MSKKLLTLSEIIADVEEQITLLLEEFANSTATIGKVAPWQQKGMPLVVAKLSLLVNLKKSLGLGIAGYTRVEEAMEYMGQHSFVSKKTGVYYEGHQPDYQSACDCINDQLVHMGCTGSVKVQDFPTLKIWKAQERAIKKKIFQEDK